MLPPAHILPFAATTSDVTLLTGTALLLGWSFTETTGSAAAEITLNDGADDTAPEILDITLSSGQSTRDYPPGNGILIRTGIFVEVVTGTVKGTIWYLPITTELDRDWAHGELGVYNIRPGV